MEFEELSVTLWAFIRTWEKDIFRRVAVAVSDCFSSDATDEVSELASIVSAVEGSTSHVVVSSRSHAWVDTNVDYLGSRYNRKLVEYPIFDLRLLKQCLRKAFSSVFGYLDPFSRKKFLLHAWKVQSIATGWCHGSVFVVSFLQESCRCRRFLKSSSTSWECSVASDRDLP